MYGYYMCMAFPHVPLAEFMMMSENADKIEPNFGQAFRNEPLPKDGYITLSDAPGWGLTFDKAAMNLIRPSAALLFRGPTQIGLSSEN